MAIGRTIGVTAFLRFNAGTAIAGMSRAEKSFKKLEDSAKKTKAGMALMQSGFAKLATLGMGVAAGAGLSAKTFALFDKASAQLESRIKGSGMSIKLFEEAALDMGRSTKFTAAEILGAMENVSKSGVKAQDILGIMPIIAKTAQAENLGLASAAEKLIAANNALGRETKDVTRTTNEMAFTAGNSAATLTRLVEGLKLTGAAAGFVKANGFSVIRMLGVFNSAAMFGSRGGTALAMALTKISKAAKEGNKVFLTKDVAFRIDKFIDPKTGKEGVNLEQTLLNAATAIKVVRDRIGGVKGAVAAAAAGMKLFGQRGGRAIGTLMKYVEGKRGEDLIKLFGPNAQKNVKGFMNRLFQIRQQNLYSDYVKLTSAVNTLGVAMSRNFGTKMRSAIQGLTSYIGDAALAFDYFTKSSDALESNMVPGAIKVGNEIIKVRVSVMKFVQEFLRAGKTVWTVLKSVWGVLSDIGGGVKWVLEKLGLWNKDRSLGKLIGMLAGVSVAVLGIAAVIKTVIFLFGGLAIAAKGAALASSGALALAGKGLAARSIAGAAGAAGTGVAARAGVAASTSLGTALSGSASQVVLAAAKIAGLGVAAFGVGVGLGHLLDRWLGISDGIANFFSKRREQAIIDENKRKITVGSAKDIVENLRNVLIAGKVKTIRVGEGKDAKRVAITREYAVQKIKERLSRGGITDVSQQQKMLLQVKTALDDLPKKMSEAGKAARQEAITINIELDKKKLAQVNAKFQGDQLSRDGKSTNRLRAAKGIIPAVAPAR
jgi:TP901 family phage tail tape measure protein